MSSEDKFSAQIFISYVEEDSTTAHEIANVLEKEGYSTWLYERDSDAGILYTENVEMMLSSSQAVIVLITPSSIGSDEVRAEIIMAHQLRKPRFPLLKGITYERVFRRRNDWRVPLAGWTALDLSNKNLMESMQRVVKGLKRLGIEPAGVETYHKQIFSGVLPKSKKNSIVLSLVLLMIISLGLLLFLSIRTAGDELEQVKPKVLGSGDFRYWSFEIEGVMSKTWKTLVPPAQIDEFFLPAGWAGKKDSIQLDKEWTSEFYSTPSSIKVIFTPCSPEKKDFAGILWVDVLFPKYSQGVNMEEVDKLTFWARGDSGGEKVEFRVGGTQSEYPQPSLSTGVIPLKETWQEYSIDFQDEPHLNQVFAGFSFITNGELNPDGCTFYLDDITYK